MRPLLLWALAAARAVHAGTMPPVEAFGSLPVTADVSISPDGNTLAWNDNSGPESRVVMFDLRTQAYRRFLRIDPLAKFRWITWSDDETALVDISYTLTLGNHIANFIGHDLRKWESFRTIAADVAGTPGRVLLMADEDRKHTLGGSTLVSLQGPSPKSVLMAAVDWFGTGTLSLFEVDTVSGHGKVMMKGAPDTVQWLAAGQGRHLARMQWDSDSRAYTVQILSGTAWRDVFHGASAQDLHMVAFSSPEGDVVVLGALGTSMQGLWRLPSDGSPPVRMTEEAAGEVEGATQDPYTGVLRSAHFGGAVPHEAWFDPVAGRNASTLAQTFPEAAVDKYGASRSGTRIVARVAQAGHAPVYELVDLDTHKATIVGEEYPGLASYRLGEVRVITCKARDGHDIPAYLTLPSGSQGKHLPLVVLVHGGPQARDEPGFDWWAQFLASRGYAVLQPQFRGSTGFGEAYAKAGDRQWGGLMQDDVSDAVAEVESQGIADPARVCIVGASYGGYAALAGAAFTPRLYKCAVSVNGIGNLLEMLAYDENRYGDEAKRSWKEHVGAQFDPKLKQHSPMYAAAQVSIPVLLLHSSDDIVVPFSQSASMAHALQGEGKPVTLVRLDGDDHWLSRGQTRIQMLREIEKFLGEHL